MTYGALLLCFSGTALFGAGWAIHDPHPLGAILFGGLAGGLGTWGYLITAHDAREHMRRVCKIESEIREREVAAQLRELLRTKRGR